MKNDLKSPAQRPPAVDTHAHVFSRELELAQERRYAPAYDATLDDFLGQLNANAIGNAVLVQPSFLGADNSYLLQALAQEPIRLKGVAVLSTDVSDETLLSLNDQGVVGVRLNLVGQPPSMRLGDQSALWKRLAELGWHVELHRESTYLAALMAPLLRAGVRVVVDHFGRPDPRLGVRDPGFKSLLDFADSERVWMKLSAAYRCVVPGAFASAHAFASDATEQLLSRFGTDHLMWGSDWPHTQFERAVNYGDTLATFEELDLDRASVDAILRTTPNAFYGFEPTDGRQGHGHEEQVTVSHHSRQRPT